MPIIVKCPSCGSQNRLRDDSDINLKATCGKCNSPLIIRQMSTPVTLTDATFDSFIQNSNKPVLVDFWAHWCQPCRLLAPVLESFCRTQHSIIVAKVDAEKHPYTSSKFQIRSIPTLILFKNSVQVKRITGTVSLQKLETLLADWITVN